MQALRKMSEKQPHLRWLIGSGLASLLMLIAIVAFTMGEPVQTNLPSLSSTDLVMIIGITFAIPATLITMNYLQVRQLAEPRPQEANESVQKQEVEQDVIPAPMEKRPIIVNGPSPELVNRLKRERDEAEHKYTELLAARQSAPEPVIERELTYGAVAALIKSGGRLGINEAQKVVRAHGGVAGRDYKPLQEVLLLLAALSPTAPSSPIHEQKQAVNSRVNGKCAAMGRSQPRRGKGKGR